MKIKGLESVKKISKAKKLEKYKDTIIKMIKAKYIYKDIQNFYIMNENENIDLGTICKYVKKLKEQDLK
jgi:translation elongation factor P/translation initiation factor 5A